MVNPRRHSTRERGYGLLGPGHLPIGEAELARRTADGGGARKWRALRSGEIDQLARLGNWAADWSSVLVCDPFFPDLIQRCRFHGLVRLGPLERLALETPAGEFQVGLYDSTFVSCDLGANVAVERVGRMAHAIVGDEAVLSGVGRLTTTPRALFGNGHRRADGGRDRIELANESGARAILPFDGILPADAALWARHRGEPELLGRLEALTDAWGDPAPGRYSTIGAAAQVLGAGALVDVRIGPHAVIDGVARLENVTLLSDADEPSRALAGAIAIDGIVGFGAELGLAVQARNFVLGTRARLESGARLSHTLLGDNSTVACCEVLACLVYPGHEQHHNNSFLIASTLEGQSNVAAGATIGSNHNSRSADGEIRAGRGFWPGLCTNFKHNCRFAAYTLVAKGNYPAELDVPLPFSLLSVDSGGLTLSPAWWFRHNMYALARNERKYRDRDRRVHARQHLVTDALAPDTAEEILTALEKMELWTGAAALRKESLTGADIPAEAAQARGRELLLGDPAAVECLDVRAGGIENARRPVRIRRIGEAYAVYRSMLQFYGVAALVDYMEAAGLAGPAALAPLLASKRERRWVNLGGQIVAGSDCDAMRAAIIEGRLDTWQAVHAEYDRLWAAWPETRARHAAAVLLTLNGVAPDQLTDEVWRDWLRVALTAQEERLELARRSRAKDFSHPFRAITFESPAEREAVLGKMDDDPTLARLAEETDQFRQRLSGFLL